MHSSMRIVVSLLVALATDKHLGKLLNATGSSGRLNVEIAGKWCVGRVGGHTHPHRYGDRVRAVSSTG